MLHGSLIQDAVLFAPLAHRAVPPVLLVPPVLHNIHAHTRPVLEELQHALIVHIANPNALHPALILKFNQRLPREERRVEVAERRVEEIRIEVRRAEVLEGGLDGRLDLCGDVGIGVVGKGLGLVLAVDGGEPAPLGASERGREKPGGRHALCLEEEVLSLDAVFIVEDLECCAYEILPCTR